MRKITIERWKFEEIREAIRIAINYREEMGGADTCMDRKLKRAWQITEDIIGGQNERRNKIKCLV